MITYRATLDVPDETLLQLTRWLCAERARLGTRRGRRSLSCRRQAVMVLGWFRLGTPMVLLAADAGVSTATGYRYLHEGIDVLADQAPDLHQVLADGARQGWSHVGLDGTLIESDRVAERTEAGNHPWYPGRHKRFGGNIQVLADPSGLPVWTSPVEPGSTHDLTAARTHALGALYRAAADGLPTLTDKGYTGAGIGIHVPVKGRHLDPDTTTRNQLPTCLRAIGERANAPLRTRWAALRRIRLCPQRIGDITAAALVLTTLERTG